MVIPEEKWYIWRFTGSHFFVFLFFFICLFGPFTLFAFFTVSFSPFLLTEPLFSWAGALEANEFGNLDAPVTNRKPYSLH